jgi:hypothetical protein
MHMSEPFEVHGRSEFRRKYVTWVSRGGLVFFTAMIVFFMIELPDAPERTFLVGMLLLVVAICVIASVLFAHGERRDSSSMVVSGEGIVMKNDYIDRLRNRPSHIDWNDVERIDSYSSPSSGSEGYGFMIIKLKNERLVSTGTKSSDDLNRVLELIPSNIAREVH